MMAGARIELPFADWPAADQAAWEALFRKGNRLDGRGAAVHWTEATRKTNRKHYARWLGWLARWRTLSRPGSARARPASTRTRAA